MSSSFFMVVVVVMVASAAPSSVATAAAVAAIPAALVAELALTAPDWDSRLLRDEVVARDNDDGQAVPPKPNAGSELKDVTNSERTCCLIQPPMGPQRVQRRSVLWLAAAEKDRNFAKQESDSNPMTSGALPQIPNHCGSHFFYSLAHSYERSHGVK
jgi:hypothetical protein